MRERATAGAAHGRCHHGCTAVAPLVAGWSFELRERDEIAKRLNVLTLIFEELDELYKV